VCFCSCAFLNSSVCSVLYSKICISICTLIQVLVLSVDLLLIYSDLGSRFRSSCSSLLKEMGGLGETESYVTIT